MRAITTSMPMWHAVLLWALCLGGLNDAAAATLKAPVHPDTLPTLTEAWDLPASMAPSLDNSYAPRTALDAENKRLYIFDHHGRRLVAVSTTDGKVLWHVPVPSQSQDVFSVTPLLASGRVFVATDGHVYSFDAATGALKWQLATKGVATSGLARSGYRLILPWTKVSGGKPSGSMNIWAIDERRAQVLYTKKLAGQIGFVSADANGIYYVNDAGLMLGLSPDRGEPMWQARVKGRVLVAPVFRKDRLYVTAREKRGGWTGSVLYAVEVKRGKILWQRKFGSELLDIDPQGDGLVAVSGDGTLLSLDGNGKPRFRLDLDFLEPATSLHVATLGARAFVFSSHVDGQGFVRLVDLEKQKLVVAANALDHAVHSARLADGILLLDGTDGTLYAYSLKSTPPKRAKVPEEEFAREMLERARAAKTPVLGLAPKLAGLGAPAVPALEAALADPNKNVVSVAAEAISLLETRRSVPALLTALDRLQGQAAPARASDDPLLPVLGALAALRDGRAVFKLAALVQADAQGHFRRRAAYVALGAIATTTALAPIWGFRAANLVESAKWQPRPRTVSRAYGVEEDEPASAATDWPEDLRKETSITVQGKDGNVYTAALSPYLGGYNDIWFGKSDLSGAIEQPRFTGLTQPEIRPNRYVRVQRLKVGETPGTVALTIQMQSGKTWVTAQPVSLALADLAADRDEDGLPDVLERRLRLCVANPDCDGDGLKDAEDLNPLASRATEPTAEQELFREAFFTYYAFLRRRGIVVVDPGKGPSIEFYGRKDPVLSLRRPSIERFRKEVGLHATDFVSFGGPYPEEGGTGDALPEVQWNAKKTEATMGIDIFRSGDNAVAYNVTLKKSGKKWVVTRFRRVFATQ